MREDGYEKVGGIGMKESDNWNRAGDYPLPPSPDAESMGEAAQRPVWPRPGYDMPSPYPDKHPERKPKKRWVAGLLAFLMPGTGHMYLGLMVKGIVMMLLLALDITAIVHVQSGENVLSVVLLSLLIPIIYFYNLFDALQSTDDVNERKQMRFWGQRPPGWEWRGGGGTAPTAEEQISRRLPPIGILLLAGTGVLIILLSGTNWTHWLFNSFGSAFGAVVLIGAGVGLWFWESRSHQRKRD
jgi:hypothetical protein